MEGCLDLVGVNDEPVYGRGEADVGCCRLSRISSSWGDVGLAGAIAGCQREIGVGLGEDWQLVAASIKEGERGSW